MCNERGGGRPGGGGGGGGFSPTADAFDDNSQPALSSSEMQSLRDYSVDDAEFINGYIVRGQSEMPIQEIIPKVQALDGVLNKSSLDKDSVVYRGIHGNLAAQLPTKAGSVITNKPYMSTSADPGVAKTFAYKDSGGVRNVMKINAPKGTKAISMKGHSEEPHEKEVLFKRNQKLSLKGITTKNGIRTYEFDAID